MSSGGGPTCQSVNARTMVRSMPRKAVETDERVQRQGNKEERLPGLAIRTDKLNLLQGTAATLPMVNRLHQRPAPFSCPYGYLQR